MCTWLCYSYSFLDAIRPTCLYCGIGSHHPVCPQGLRSIQLSCCVNNCKYIHSLMYIVDPMSTAKCLQCLHTAAGVGLVLQDTEETTDLIITSQYNLLLLHGVEGRGGE